MAANTVAKIYELAQPLAEELGLIIWDIVFEKEGANYYLRVFIDKDEGISMDDCEAFTRPLNKILDEADPIEQSYILEVGSPGLGRELRKPEHFELYKGYGIRIRFIRPLENGEKEIVGTLKDYDRDSVRVDGITYKLSDTAFIRAYDDEDLFQ